MERSIALATNTPIRKAVRIGYPLLREGLGRLSQAGVETYDLTDTFASVEESVYVDDCCHVGKVGNEILALTLASRLTGGHTRSRQPEALVFSPRKLHVTDPLAPVPIQVHGVRGDERWDVTSHPQTTLRSLDTKIVAVRPGGTLVVKRRGLARVEATHGPLKATLPIEVSWPAVLHQGQGTKGAGGAPHLTVKQVRKREEEFLILQIENARASALVALYLTPTRTPLQTLGADDGPARTPGGTWIPLKADEAGRLELTFPKRRIPAGADPLYLWCFAHDPSARFGWSISNGLVLAFPKD